MDPTGRSRAGRKRPWENLPPSRRLRKLASQDEVCAKIGAMIRKMRVSVSGDIVRVPSCLESSWTKR